MAADIEAAKLAARDEYDVNWQRSTNPVRVAAGASGRCREGIDV